jgi:hypothetical protein
LHALYAISLHKKQQMPLLCAIVFLRISSANLAKPFNCTLLYRNRGRTTLAFYKANPRVALRHFRLFLHSFAAGAFFAPIGTQDACCGAGVGGQAPNLAAEPGQDLPFIASSIERLQ